jgi:hypothetical protein
MGWLLGDRVLRKDTLAIGMPARRNQSEQVLARSGRGEAVSVSAVRADIRPLADTRSAVCANLDATHPVL